MSGNVSLESVDDDEDSKSRNDLGIGRLVVGWGRSGARDEKATTGRVLTDIHRMEMNAVIVTRGLAEVVDGFILLVL